jgi:outer membrane protein OmpA-like peptidoglycan-associated protein
VSATPPTPTPPAAPPAPPAKSGSSGCVKFLIIFLIIVLIVCAGIGVAAWWAYQKAKQKVEEIKTQVNQGISQATSGVPGGADVHQDEPCPAADASALDFEHATIPMRVGLTMAKVWTTNKGDLETLTQVQSVDDHSVNVTASSPDRNDPQKTVHGRRNICIADLNDGSLYVTSWGATYPDTMRQVTMFSLSQAEFQALKNKGETPFTYYDGATRTPGGYTLERKSEGTLARAEANDVPVSVIVNEQKVDLPTIHAKGTLSGHPAELWAVDDPKNPVVLDYEMPDTKFKIKIMKISFPETKSIETELEKEGRAQVYGIYFDFNSATIRPESEPVLKEIADALNNHPDWKLSVNGHTDNVGGDTYNQKLSVKRAESVKQALVENYQIAADRLQTAGLGASSPIDTNDTPEGRARNRRVELIKQ